MTCIRNMRVGRANDRRVKLSDEDKKEIIRLREKGESFQRIAMRYDVSHTLIQYICKPELADKNREGCSRRAKEGRYKPSREKINASLREHYAYKKKLWRENKIHELTKI